MLKRLGFAFLVLLWMNGAAAAQDGPAEKSRAIIQSMADRVLSSLKDESQTREDREELYADLFRQHFAIPVIARWVMGRPWREASEAQREEFVKVFEDYIVHTYAIQFAGFTGEDFTVAGAEPEGENGAVVISEIRSPEGGEVTQVRWRFRPDEDGQLRIRDVVVDNISMAVTQRREFASIYHRRGGTVDGLIAALKEKVTELERRG